MKKVRFLGNIYGYGQSFDGAVFDKKGIAPTLKASASHGPVKIIVKNIKKDKIKK